jgi:predicted nucleic acid-binding protein
VVVAGEFVLDASVTIPWIFRDEKCGLADRTWNVLVSEAGVAHIPGIWVMEVINVPLLGPKDRKRPKPTKQDRDLYFAVLRKLPLRVHYQGLEPLLDYVVPLMEKYKDLTCYDAAYVLLAKRTGLPLVTRDGVMEGVAVAEGVKVLK